MSNGIDARPGGGNGPAAIPEPPGGAPFAERTVMIFLAVLSFALFVTNAGSYDLWPPDEPRFAEVAREMLLTGDWLAPRVNGMPYLEKPPLLFWLIALVSLPFGGVTELSARIPSIASAIATVLLTYALARRLYGRRVALWSAVLLMTGARFWWQARTAQIDMLLTACLMLSLFAFWQWHAQRKRSWLLLFYAGMAFGMYAKGPVAVIIPMLMIIAFYWGRRADRRRLHWVLGVLAVVALIALWLIPARAVVSPGGAEATSANIAENLYRQTIGRFFLGVSKAQPPWYYLTTLPVDWLPWTLFLPWVVYWAWRRRRDGDAMRLLLAWTLPSLVFFTACSGKRAIYLLPLFPALAILFACGILDLLDSLRTGWRRGIAVGWAALLQLFAAAPWVALRFEPEMLAPWKPEMAVLSACAGVFGLMTLYRALRRGDPRFIHAVMAAHMAALMMLAVLLVFPIVNEFKGAKAFCAPVRRAAEAGADFNLYSVGFTREEYVFYAKHFHVPVLAGDDPLPLPTDIPDDEEAVLEPLVIRAVMDAARQVPVQDVAAPTEEERANVRGAIEMAFAAAQSKTQYAQVLRKELMDVLAQFRDDMFGEKPALAFVRQEDWLWITALEPALREIRIVQEDSVGSRDVFLLANAAGEALLK